MVLAGATLMSCVAPAPPPAVASADDDDGDSPDAVATAPASTAVVVRPAPPPVAVRVGVGFGPLGVVVGSPGPRPIAVLPPGARRVWVRHHRVWVCNGVYYRRGPSGYVVVRA